MSFHNVVGTGSYTTSTTNMYNKDFTHRVCSPSKWPSLGVCCRLGTVPSLVGRHGCFGCFALPQPPHPPTPPFATTTTRGTEHAAVPPNSIFHTTAPPPTTKKWRLGVWRWSLLNVKKVTKKKSKIENKILLFIDLLNFHKK